MKLRNEWNDTTSLFFSKQETIDSVRKNFDLRRKYSAEGHSVVIKSQFEDVGVSEDVIIQDHTNPINIDKTDKKLLTPLSLNITSGSYVIYRGDYWLVVSKVNNVDDGYHSSQIQQCTYNLKYQNKDGEVKTIPIVAQDATKYSSGEKVYQQVSILVTQQIWRLPLTKETASWGLGKRFIADSSLYASDIFKATGVLDVYELTKRDVITSDNVSQNGGGVLRLTVSKVELDTNVKPDGTYDNIELMVADYFEPKPKGANVSIVYSGQPEIRYGRSKTFSVEVEEQEEDSPVFAWEINVPIEIQDYVTLVDNLDGTVTVTVSNYSNLVDKTFILRAFTQDQTSHDEVEIKIVGVF